MKKNRLKVSILLNLMLIISVVSNVHGQNELTVPPSNRSTATLEKNLLFYADVRYTVSQQGSVSLPLSGLFNGNYHPYYSANGIDPANPYVITIENLPNIHVQAASWIGWTTRYWGPSKFKIEVFNIDESYSQNTWVTIADIDGYESGSYMIPVAYISISKIRYTFYKGQGPENVIGLSELFFIHPEATVAYDGLMVKYDAKGNVGIGTENTNGDKLAVKGNLHAQQVTVDMYNWADHVFSDNYQLLSLKDLQAYLIKNCHLPDIPSQQYVLKNGLNLGEINKLLTQKIEELTLYLIEKDLQFQKVDEKQKEAFKIQAVMQAQLEKLQAQLNQFRIPRKKVNN